MVQHGAAQAGFDDVRAHLVACALDGATGRCPPHVAVMRLADGTPKLLTQPALDALCARLTAQLEAGERGDPQHTPAVLQVRRAHWGVGVPCRAPNHAPLCTSGWGCAVACPAGLVRLPAPLPLQAYVPPFLDLRYVASYTNDGLDTSCHTFQRRFSRRYLPYREPQQAPPPGLLTAGQCTVEQPQAEDGAPAAAEAVGVAGGLEAASGAPSDAVAPTRGAAPAEAAGAAAAGVASAGEQDQAGAEEEEVALDDAALADSERLLGRALGPVDPSLKMAARKAVHGLVQYVQKAHLLTLRGLAAEFVRDAQGHLWLLGPLRCDWASLIPGTR